MKLTKMQGLGNDYLYHFGAPENPAELAVRLSERHFGIGSDGLILISPSDVADFRMRIFNADGSEANMCGNGIRCVGKFVYDKGYTDRTQLTIETRSGIRTLSLQVRCGKVTGATVDMGRVRVLPPVNLRIGTQMLTCTPVSVGNPHAVTFVQDVQSVALETLGAALSTHTAFPDGVNAEFVQVIDRKTLRMRVFERGSGITMACGTGACASVAAAVQAGYCAEDEQIAVLLDGGALQICALPDGSVQMTGPAVTICECEVAL